MNAASGLKLSGMRLYGRVVSNPWAVKPVSTTACGAVPRKRHRPPSSAVVVIIDSPGAIW